MEVGLYNLYIIFTLGYINDQIQPHLILQIIITAEIKIYAVIIICRIIFLNRVVRMTFSAISEMSNLSIPRH